MTSRNGLPSPREPPRPNITRACSFISRMCSCPSTAMTPSTIASSIAVILACSCSRSWIFSRSRPAITLSERPSVPISSVERVGARTRKLPSLICRAMDCISTTGRVTRPATKMPMPERDEQGHRAARQHHLVERGVRGGHRGERQGEPQDPEHAGPFPHRHRHVQERGLGGGAPAQGPPRPARQRLENLGPRRVVLERRQVRERAFRLRQHPAVRRDEGDARARSPAPPGRPDPAPPERPRPSGGAPGPRRGRRRPPSRAASPATPPRSSRAPGSGIPPPPGW